MTVNHQKTARLVLQGALSCLLLLLAVAIWVKAAVLIFPLLFAVEAVMLLPPVFRQVYDEPEETWWNAALLGAACATAVVNLLELCLPLAQVERLLSVQGSYLTLVGVLIGLEGKALWPKVLYTALLCVLLTLSVAFKGGL